MAKKGFKKGLEDLFGEPVASSSSDNAMSLFPDKKPNASKAKKSSSKGFSSRLDAILADAFETEKEPSKKASPQKKKPRLTGLDLLIRQTGDQPTPPQKSSLRRRLTLALDKEQLERLKEIAKEEGIYLKDLMAKVVDRYLEKHADKE